MLLGRPKTADAGNCLDTNSSVYSRLHPSQRCFQPSISRYFPMRIVSGKFAGRHLTSPSRNVRPTSEGVRDRWLELLEADLTGARVLDLFAGSGAIGLEAISRGARYADFVENGAGALHSLKANVAVLRVTKKCRVFKQDAIPFVARLDTGAYDVCFADPPYGSRKLDLVIERWREIAFAGVLAIEHSKNHDIAMKGKSYDLEGDTRVTVLRR